MRRFLRYVSVMLLLLVLCACGTPAPGGTPAANMPSPAPEGTGETERGTVSLGVTLTAEDVTSTGLTLVCTQSGGAPTGELQTGSPFWLEAGKDGYWSPVESSMEEIVWTMEAWGIPMDDSVMWEVNWENLYGELPTGEYRIFKEIMDFRGPGDFDTYSCCAEFSVK